MAKTPPAGEDVTVKDPRVEAEEQDGVGDGMRSEQASSSRFQAGDDPHVRQAMDKLAQGETSQGFTEILSSLPENMKCRGDAGLIEAVLKYVNSKKLEVRQLAEQVVLGLMVKNDEELANAMVEMFFDRAFSTNRRRAVLLMAMGKCGETVPDSSLELDAEKIRYRDLAASAPEKRNRIAEIKKKQAQIKRMRAEQGLDDDDEKVKSSSGLRDKVKGRQKSETAQLDIELEELEKQIFSLDSGNFEAELQAKEEDWQKLRQKRIAFNALLVDTLLDGLADKQKDVRDAAFRSIASLAARPDIKILDAMLKDISAAPEAAAIHILGQTAPVGHDNAVAMAVKCLGVGGSIGRQALEALGHIAVPGDLQSLDCVLHHMEKGDTGVRELASAAVSIFARIGDEAALCKVRRFVSHRSRDVRITAIKTLILLCRPGQGDDRVIPSLLMCLQSDKDELVRVEALKALSVCAKPNDPLTLSVLVNSVTDASAAVRQRAPLVLAFLTLAQPQIDNKAVSAEAAAAAEASVSAEAEAAAAKATSQGGQQEKEEDQSDLSDMDLQRRETQKRAKAVAAKKAIAEAGALAVANAHLEREQYREIEQKSVANMLMLHVQGTDVPSRCAALWTIGMLSSSGACSADISGLFISQLLHFSTSTQDSTSMALILEGLCLLCGHDGVELALCMCMDGCMCMGAAPVIMQHYLEEFHALSQDLKSLKASRMGGNRNSLPTSKKGQDSLHASMSTLNESSATRDTDIFGCRFSGFIKEGNMEGLGRMIEKYREIVQSRLVPLLIVRDNNDAEQANREAARRWTGIIALKRCALEASAQHVALKAHNAQKSECEKLDAKGVDVGSPAGKISGFSKPVAYVLEEHVLFEGLAGDRLKNTVFQALLDLIEKEQEPIVRGAAVRLFLDLCPRGGDTEFQSTEGAVKDTVNQVLFKRISLQLEEWNEEQANDEAAAADEANHQRVRLAQREAKRPREKGLVELYLQLLGDLGELNAYHLFDHALSECNSKVWRAVPNSGEGKDNKNALKKEEATKLLLQDLRKGVDTLLELVNLGAHSRYYSKNMRMLAIRALGLVMRRKAMPDMFPAIATVASVLKGRRAAVEEEVMSEVQEATMRKELELLEVRKIGALKIEDFSAIQEIAAESDHLRIQLERIEKLRDNEREGKRGEAEAAANQVMESDPHMLTTVLGALLHLDVEVGFGRPKVYLKIISQLLSHNDAAVRHLAAEVLNVQMFRADYAHKQDLVEQLLDLLAHLSSEHDCKTQAREHALRVLSSAIEAKIIQTSAALVHGIEACLYDQDIIVRTQALDLLTLLQRRSAQEAALSAMYEAIDVDNSGQISLAELRFSMCRQDESVSEAQVQERFDLINVNQDGLVSREGFVHAHAAALAAAEAGSVSKNAFVQRHAAAAAALAAVEAKTAASTRHSLIINGENLQTSGLLKQPAEASRSVESIRNWIGTLKRLASFEADSVRAVTEKLSSREHWSVRRAAVEYLLQALKAPPPPRPPPPPPMSEDPMDIAGEGVSRKGAAMLSKDDVEKRGETVLIGWENEPEVARRALEYMQSHDAGVCNAAVHMLAAVLQSGNGAREVILEGDTLEKLLSDQRRQQLCFKAFASDKHMLSRCQEVLHGDSSVLLRRSAVSNMCAVDVNDPMSFALDTLLICSQDGDKSVRDRALDQWVAQDFSACNTPWLAAVVERLLKYTTGWVYNRDRKKYVYEHKVMAKNMSAGRAIAVKALPPTVARGDRKVVEKVASLLEDSQTDVRSAAAEVLVQIAYAEHNLVERLVNLVDRDEREWFRRDDAQMEIKAAAFWVLSNIQPQFTHVPNQARQGGNASVVRFLLGNDAERELIRQHELDAWVRALLAVGDRLMIKVRRAIADGRWEDARHDANAAMNEYLMAKSKGSHPDIWHRILGMDLVFFDIANFRGKSVVKAIDAKIRDGDTWVPDVASVDRQGWTRLHYLSRWGMTDIFKEMVDAGHDINAEVLSGPYKGCTCYDLAQTEVLREFIRNLGGGPSKGSVPNFLLERPEIPRPTDFRTRSATNMDEIMHDSRDCVYIHDISILDLPPPKKWIPEREHAKKDHLPFSISAFHITETLQASTRVRATLRPIVPLANHAVNFVDTLSDDDDDA